MKRFLTLFFIVFYLNSCVEEYDVFTPYVNDSIGYIEQFKTKPLILTFSNDEKFEYFSESGFQLKIPANSFPKEVDKVNVLMKYNTSLLDIISSGVQTTLADGTIFSFDKIFDFKFRDDKNNKIELNADKEILVKIPYSKNNVPQFFNYSNGFWHKTKPETIDINKSTWFTNDVDSILVKGYKVRIKKAAHVALASNLTQEEKINDLSIRLEKGFDVSNSLALLTIKNTQAIISLKWNPEEKVFNLPENTILPLSDIVIIVFSEDSDKNIYFGMNYAKVTNGDIVDIKLERKNIKEIKQLIDSISM